MRKRIPHRFVIWALTVALLNLSLTMMPAGSPLAATAAGVPAAAAMHQVPPDGSPCHETMAAMADHAQPAETPCADGSCSDHCPWCAQPAAGLPQLFADLISLGDSFQESPASRLSSQAPSLLLPPPRPTFT